MTNLDFFAIAAQITSGLFMAGVISVIQLVHYPSFILIERDKFSIFHSHHSKALGFIAGPFMCVELISSIWLAKSGSFLFVINAISVALLWGLTFFVIVPVHNKLSTGFDEKAWKRLLTTNWLRTFLWVGRALMFSGWLVALLRSTQ